MLCSEAACPTWLLGWAYATGVIWCWSGWNLNPLRREKARSTSVLAFVLLVLATRPLFLSVVGCAFITSAVLGAAAGKVVVGGKRGPATLHEGTSAYLFSLVALIAGVVALVWAHDPAS